MDVCVRGHAGVRAHVGADAVEVRAGGHAGARRCAQVPTQVRGGPRACICGDR